MTYLDLKVTKKIKNRFSLGRIFVEFVHGIRNRPNSMIEISKFDLIRPRLIQSDIFRPTKPDDYFRVTFDPF